MKDQTGNSSTRLEIRVADLLLLISESPTGTFLAGTFHQFPTRPCNMLGICWSPWCFSCTVAKVFVPMPDLHHTLPNHIWGPAIPVDDTSTWAVVLCRIRDNALLWLFTCWTFPIGHNSVENSVPVCFQTFRCHGQTRVYPLDELWHWSNDKHTDTKTEFQIRHALPYHWQQWR